MKNVPSFEKIPYSRLGYIIATKTVNLGGAEKHGYNLRGHCFIFDLIASFKLRSCISESVPALHQQNFLGLKTFRCGLAHIGYVPQIGN